MTANGTAHKYGDDINTDVIIPARYLNNFEPQELAKHCMEDIDSNFVSKIHSGDIIAAGKNFGCGSSREHAPIAIKAAGISLVIAESFARIFYRNAINIGLAIMECPRAGEIEDGDSLSVDFDSGTVKNLSSGEEYAAEPFPDFIKNIISSGGLLSTL